MMPQTGDRSDCFCRLGLLFFLFFLGRFATAPYKWGNSDSPVGVAFCWCCCAERRGRRSLPGWVRFRRKWARRFKCCRREHTSFGETAPCPDKRRAAWAGIRPMAESRSTAPVKPPFPAQSEPVGCRARRPRRAAVPPTTSARLRLVRMAYMAVPTVGNTVPGVPAVPPPMCTDVRRNRKRVRIRPGSTECFGCCHLPGHGLDADPYRMACPAAVGKTRALFSSSPA